jgi:hypothetical protein
MAILMLVKMLCILTVCRFIIVIVGKGTIIIVIDKHGMI